MPQPPRSSSRLGEPRIPLSFKVVTDPDDLPGIQTQDFKADRTVPPIEVSNELQQNMKDYLECIEHEKKLALRMKKALDDVASVVQNGVEFDKEISGAAVVDMQVVPGQPPSCSVPSMPGLYAGSYDSSLRRRSCHRRRDNLI